MAWALAAYLYWVGMFATAIIAADAKRVRVSRLVIWLLFWPLMVPVALVLGVTK